MRQTASDNLRRGRSESGVVLLFGIFIILSFALVAGMLIDVGVAELRMREIQSQIDGASLAAANILDLRPTDGVSTQTLADEKRQSFLFAKEAAWRYLQLAEIVETPSPPTDNCETGLDEEGWRCTSWTIGARTVTIERGLYYRDGVNPQFLSLEGAIAPCALDPIWRIFPLRCDGDDPGEDPFWFANAVRIVVTDDTVRGAFSIAGLFTNAQFQLASRDTVSSKGMPVLPDLPDEPQQDPW